MVKLRLRHIVESLSAGFLFLFQYIPVGGAWWGPMCYPIAFYIFHQMWASPDYGDFMFMLLLSEGLMFGRIVTIVGFTIFLVALLQFMEGKDELLRSGLYAVVRHPQYLGLIVTTLGMTLMCVEFGCQRYTMVWLIEVFGYILLAGYEEQHLLREHEESYSQYRQKTPFILFIPRSSRIPEALSTMGVAIIIWILLSSI